MPGGARGAGSPLAWYASKSSSASAVTIPESLWSGKAVARTGLRMMPTFPPPPLRFRTVGFPQYGSKASLSAWACPGGDEVKPTPGMPASPPEFAPRLRGAGGYGIGTPPVTALPGNPARPSPPAPPLTPGVLGSGRVVLSRRSLLLRPHAPVSGAPGDFTTPRRLYPGPSLGGRAGRDPRDLPSFPCRAVRTCRRPYAGGVAAASRCAPAAIPGFRDLSARRPPHPPALPAIPAGATLSTLHRSLQAAARAFAQPSGLAPTGGESSRLLRDRCPPRIGAGRHRPGLGGRLDG